MTSETKFQILQHIYSISKSCEKIKEQLLNPLINCDDSNASVEQIGKHLEAIKNLKRESK